MSNKGKQIADRLGLQANRHRNALLILVLGLVFTFMHANLLLQTHLENQHRIISELVIISAGLLQPQSIDETRERLNMRMDMQGIITLTVEDDKGNYLLRMGPSKAENRLGTRFLPVFTVRHLTRNLTVPAGTIRVHVLFDHRPAIRDLLQVATLDSLLILFTLLLHYHMKARRQRQLAVVPVAEPLVVQPDMKSVTDPAIIAMVADESDGRRAPQFPQWIANLNQALVTPIGHIRAGTDALSENQCTDDERVSLAMIRVAADNMRQTVENLIDSHALVSHALHYVPRRVSIREAMEDLCAEWQPTAQEKGLLINLVVFRDVPQAIETDGRLLRRALSNLLNRAVQVTSKGSLTLTVQEMESTDGNLATIEFVISSSDPNAVPRLQKMAEKELDETPPDPAHISAGENILGLVREYARLLGGSLFIHGLAVPHQEGTDWLCKLAVQSRVLTPAPTAIDRLAGQSCLMWIDDPWVRRAWRNTLLSLGANVVEQADISKVNWVLVYPARRIEEPTYTDQIRQLREQGVRVIGLCPHIDLRGRPLHCPDLADLCLPAFVRFRSLIAELSSDITTVSSVSGSAFPERQALVIDDDPVYRAYLKNVLEKFGIQVVTAQSGADGIRIARNRDLDIILTDMNMPGLDGVAVTRYLRRDHRHANTPIVAITANVQADVHQTLQKAGVDALLCKPISRGELVNVLERFLQPQRESGTGEENIGEMLSDLLCQELPDYYKIMIDKQADREQLQYAAHKLRGAAACCQESALQQAAGELEDLLLHPNPLPSEIAQRREEVIRQIQSVIDSLCSGASLQD